MATEYKPVLGGTTGASFLLQFGDAPLSPLSLSTTLVTQLSNDGKDNVVSHGSGFFWRHADKIYLVTARHVVSGRNPFDNQLLSTNGYVPIRFKVYPAIEIALGRFIRIDCLIEFDEDSHSNWLQDVEFESLTTDIAAVLIEGLSGPVRCLNDDPIIFENIFTGVGMDCAVVGYPTTLFAGLMTQIWRRGTIASEPFFPVDNKPMFLLDAATSPGFSGSPVFRTHYGPLPVRQLDGSMTIQMDRILTTSFIGVYAGRLQHTHLNGEVPFVFHGNRLKYIIT